MHVAVINRQRTLKIEAPQVAALVEEVLRLEGSRCQEVGIHFIGLSAMRQLHGQFFQDFSATDCIAFPLDETLLGDVFICPQVAKAYVQRHGGNVYRETSLYIVHGLLHLMGYDDIREKNRQEMRKAEERHMRHLARKRLLLELA